MKRLALLLCAALACPAAAAEPPLAARTARLAKLCKIWGTVKFLHPWIWTRDNIDWDAALLQAQAKAGAATSDDEFAAAVNDMLRALHDPATRVTATSDGPRPAPPSGAPFLSWPQSGALLLRVGVPHTPADLAKATAALKEAKRVILDLRVAQAYGESWNAYRDARTIFESLITHELRVPPKRWVVHDGYRPQNGVTSGGYQSLFEEQSVTVIPPKTGAMRRPLAVVTNQSTGVPDEVLALQASGEALIVVQGVTFDDLVAGGSPLPLDSNHVVRMRRFELVPMGATPHADAELTAETDDRIVVETALKMLAAAQSQAKPKAAAPLPPLLWRPDKDYANEHAPSVELRMLALFRLWTVIDLFYPYKSLLDEPWDQALTAYIPRFESATNAQAYVETLAELATHIADAHTRLRGGDDPVVNLPARPRLLAQMIENQAVIAAIGADAETQALGLHVGDVIMSVDGEPIATRMTRLRRLVPASNSAWRELRTLANALAGADGSVATITVRDAAGKTREVKLMRRTPSGRDLNWRSGDVVRVLDGNVGYVDLDRLTPGEVDAMFDRLGNTRAIIFDMRGYPNGTAWAIAPRLNVRHATHAAAFERCVVHDFDAEVGCVSRFKFMQSLPANRGNQRLYHGKTLMLVDERTISQSEHTGLFFEAATGTRFVGSQTAGANGDVTTMTLPGGLTLSFTGHDVRHADGRQLQRVGLPIDYLVKPTVKGVQAGRDEVLERALALLRADKSHASTSSR
jgi:C-terminal processing protease CtpA/Prc